MRYFRFIGDGSGGGDFETLSHYIELDSLRGNPLDPPEPTYLPESGDTVNLYDTSLTGLTGTLVANLDLYNPVGGYASSLYAPCLATFLGEVSNFETLEAGTFSGGLSFGDMYGSSLINGGTYNCSPMAGMTVNGGTFNVPITQEDMAGPYLNGGSVHNAPVTNNAYFDYSNPQSPTTAGTFNDDLIFTNGCPLYINAIVNHRVSLNGGYTWLYSPNSPDVAPPTAVVAPTTNLGVSGVVDLAAVAATQYAADQAALPGLIDAAFAAATVKVSARIVRGT